LFHLLVYSSLSRQFGISKAEGLKLPMKFMHSRKDFSSFQVVT
jgi:hypothetical protein